MIEDIFRQMAGGMGGQAQRVNLSVDKVDEFIDKCMSMHDLSLQGLAFEIKFLLQPPNGQQTILSLPEVQTYPMVLKRIQQRLGSE